MKIYKYIVLLNYFLTLIYIYYLRVFKLKILEVLVVRISNLTNALQKDNLSD